MGFTVKRETGLCRFYSSRYPTTSNSIQYGITSYTKHWPPSPYVHALFKPHHPLKPHLPLLT